MRSSRDRVPAGILLIGLAMALVIYVGAGPPSDVAAERAEDSKRYLRQMEVYGGTANVLASQAREWFSGLWQGRRLAFTVAVLSGLAAGIAWVALSVHEARHASPGAREGR